MDIWRLKRRGFMQASAFCGLVSIKFYLGVQNPKTIPIFPENQKPRVNCFLMVRDRRKISQDHFYKIGFGKSIPDIRFCLARPLAVDLYGPTLCVQREAEIISKRYETQGIDVY